MITNQTLDIFFQDAIKQYNLYLSKYLTQLSCPDPLLLDAIKYVLNMPSKKFRAKLVYASGQIFSLPFEILNPLALAIEMIHAYSLVHDDLPAMDNDDWRRGVKSCHKAFDEATAILTGSALNHLAFEVLIQQLPEHNHCLQIIQTILHYIGPQGILSGQNMDLHLLTQHQLPLEKLIQIHHLKTSTLFHAIVDSVCILGQAKLEEKQSLNLYVNHLGLAYQMFDDYGDFYASEHWGKHKSSDLFNQKNTYVKFFEKQELKQQIQNQLNQAEKSIEYLTNPEYNRYLIQLIIEKVQAI
jgi:farnesyl diphosphate synthase